MYSRSPSKIETRTVESQEGSQEGESQRTPGNDLTQDGSQDTESDKSDISPTDQTIAYQTPTSCKTGPSHTDKINKAVIRMENVLQLGDDIEFAIGTVVSGQFYHQINKFFYHLGITIYSDKCFDMALFENAAVFPYGRREAWRENATMGLAARNTGNESPRPYPRQVLSRELRLEENLKQNLLWITRRNSVRVSKDRAMESKDRRQQVVESIYGEEVGDRKRLERIFDLYGELMLSLDPLVMETNRQHTECVLCGSCLGHVSI